MVCRADAPCDGGQDGCGGGFVERPGREVHGADGVADDLVDAFNDAICLRIFHGQWAREDSITGKEFGEFGAEFGAVVEDDGVGTRILCQPFSVEEQGNGFGAFVVIRDEFDPTKGGVNDG